ncbi:MAG: aliphatic sulfonate ABC transporter permease SsuC [Pseudanabaena sp.]|jgi:sulfonate transport system permease protein|uniref:aliphatic sulfonate ABC transporter permease SsuC n=1 Tax=Pseudanabaena mucicola TaxID=71190 RepID=UPI002A3C04FF|nr:aliphatic sulfonate ABC transporter permease SsuC [Pseudanabaena sp. M135S2SP2A07QC]MCA6585132.1 aliphatic sulfonate ABC transporter permease SsuC [Pseudanabaena sp. M051S1SP1A06QC]MCA6588175.1 aliphatic sulfonate ABC transporter permease SsuC [Pseudanabaena sp. M109S1SP1A06QC]MCA6595327.1 aliphatic sulfonate ABC transporter permease SsuC [Pseudanabaena sp. M046S1SP1A06QC]MCA6606341.1 aliphatic sulfonate ABC transporter permease SsuC [Pseudanabaena sp. M007S1SP1A06QC]MCA6611735.1 aliphatic 
MEQSFSASPQSVPKSLSQKLRNPLYKVWRSFLPWLVPMFAIVLWQLLSQAGVISSKILPAPLDVLKVGIKLAQSGELLKHITISGTRALIGFAIGGGIGFLLGLINGSFIIAETLLDTSLQMLRNIPHLALIPLVILWFGIGEEAKIFLVVIGVMFPIYLNTYHGIRTVDSGLIEMGKVYGLNSLKIFWEIVLPSALPSILVGVRFSLGIMWLTLIVSETIASDSGIGYLAMNAREFLQTDVVVFAILLYALLGKLADAVARFLESSLLQWHPSYSKSP